MVECVDVKDSIPLKILFLIVISASKVFFKKHFILLYETHSTEENFRLIT